MNLNNLSMNYKIILGISTVTILTLIYQYIKNLFNPNKKLLEGQNNNITELSAILDERHGKISNNNNDNNNNNNFYLTNKQLNDQTQVIGKIYEEISEFNHIYQERLFEDLVPTQIRKTIIHLSSVNLENKNEHNFRLASRENNGLRRFQNVINFKLLGAQIPYVPHNIYENNNGSSTNVLIFDDNNITIEEGYYTIYTLINTINNNLSALGISATLTFDNLTKFITINGTVSISITTTQLFKRLGFIQNSSGTTITATNIPDLSIHFIDIIYNNINPRGATLTNDDGNILKRIPLKGQPGDMIYYDVPATDYQSQELFIPDINSNIPEIQLVFKRNDGSIYNFKGLDYDLKIEMTELVEPTLLRELGSHMRRDRSLYLENSRNRGDDTLRSFDNLTKQMTVPVNDNNN
jgi:hypothetical protein